MSYKVLRTLRLLLLIVPIFVVSGQTWATLCEDAIGPKYKGPNILLRSNSPDSFRTLIPDSLFTVADSWALPLKPPAKAAMERIIEITRTFINEGPGLVEAVLYGHFARSNKLLEKTEAMGITFDSSPIPYDRLPDKYKREWDLYKYGGKPMPRRWVFEAVKNLTWRLGQLPSTRYLFEDAGPVDQMKSMVETGQLQLVAKLFTNLTDAEAKIIFGQNITARDVLLSIESMP